jgi:hypothetical protein
MIRSLVRFWQRALLFLAILFDLALCSSPSKGGGALIVGSKTGIFYMWATIAAVKNTGVDFEYVLL